MSAGMRAGTVTMPMRFKMRWKKHCKPMMDQCRMARTDLGTCDVKANECKDGDDAGTDAEEETSEADDVSMQNVAD
jgi:hypothetical protein